MEEHGSDSGAESAKRHLPEGEVSPHLARWKLNRRQLLQLAAGAAAAGAASRGVGPIDLLGGAFRAVEASPAFAGASSPDFSVSVLRARDLLKLRFDFFNLQLKTDLPLGQRLEKVVAGRPGFIVVNFPPQNIAEEAYLLTSNVGADPDLCGDVPCDVPVDETPDGPGEVQTRLAGSSRLAFVVPEDVDSIPYTLEGPEGLLAWERFEQKVAPAALPPPPIIVSPWDIILSSDHRTAVEGPVPVPVPEPIPEPDLPPPIREPLPTETAIEAPWRLIISPNKFAAWAHARDPVTRNGRTELWHTRLGVRGTDPAPHVDEESEFLRKIRAVWTLPTFDKDTVPEVGDDSDSDGVPEPFRMSLTRNDRYQIVRLSADFSEDYTPQPIEVERFMLSSLGAWMKTRGFWDILTINTEPLEPLEPAPFDFSLTEWRHIATMGRDHYVRVVYLGYLFPFGHPAALIKITERKFQPVPDGKPLSGHTAAYLQQRFFIVVRKPVMTYPADSDSSQPHEARQMPFKRVRITTLVTPNLQNPNDTEHDLLGLGQDAFWPRVVDKLAGDASGDFRFHLVAEDFDGQRSEFTLPLAFVSTAFSDNETVMDDLADVYNGIAAGGDPPVVKDRRSAQLRGQKVAFAESDKAGDTTLEVSEVIFGASLPDPPSVDLPPDQPRFFPTVRQAKVRLSAAEQASGGNAPATIEFHPTYLADEFNGANKGEVFAKMVNPVDLDFTTDKSGGSITPNMKIQGLSRLLGPVGGNLDATLGGDFSPADFFAGAEAKILGGLDLFQVIQAANLLDPGGLDKALKITTRRLPEGAEVPEAVETTMKWNATTKSESSEKFFEPTISDPQVNGLTLTAKFITKLDAPGDSTFEVVGELKNFNVNLLGKDSFHFITIQFNKLVFTSKKGQKPDVDVDIAGVEFDGMLKLVNELQSFLQSGSGFSGIDVLLPPDPNAGIRAGYSVGLPSIAVGVFSLQNISLSAGLTIPFLGDPVRVRFAFCERENPFILTVSLFGGGGFFGIGLGLDGVELLEASFEFGAGVALDVGVASGGVYIMAGVYFKMEFKPTGDEAQLTGYLRAGGELDVLGIVSVSIELYLGLTYDIDADEVWGQATLTIEVEILFFSLDFSTTVERKFAGSTHPLTFIDLVPPNNPLDFTQGSDAWNEYADAFAAVPA